MEKNRYHQEIQDKKGKGKERSHERQIQKTREKHRAGV